MAAFPLTGHALHKTEMEYNGKFGHTLGRIQHIALMIRIDLYYATCNLATQTVAPTLPGFQGIKRYIQYLDINPHKPIFYPFNYYYGSNVIRLTQSGNKFEDHTTQNCLECHQNSDYAIILNIRRSVLGIIHTLLSVAVFWKVQIQPYIASDSTDGEIRCMYKFVNKTKVIRIYMESLAIHTGATTVHWETTRVVFLLLKLNIYS